MKPRVDELPELLGLEPRALVDRLNGPGRARAVYAVLREGGSPFEEGALGPKARARLVGAARPTASRIARVHCSADGAMKLLIALGGGLGSSAVEAVLIPEARRTTLCVSSQIGCARGCTFCLTATMKLVRNLSAAEIAAEVVAGISIAKASALPPLRNLVFMGMGEPLDNLEAVERALAVITGSGLGLGFGPAHVTVSTVGPSPAAIHRARSLPGRLAWSLHAADDAVRRKLVPTQRAGVEDLARAFREVVEAREEALFVEITLIDGVNDGPVAAEAIVRLFERFAAEVRFNLLPMNPIGDATALRASPPDRVAEFAERLKRAGYFAMIRKPRGDDEGAACGQLAVLGGSCRQPLVRRTSKTATPALSD
jgi:23S rRNA (adenine2503-C2)-methyltransferase